ncbi:MULTISPECIES: phage major capsid protein [unclassified Oceanobacillus]|uniref:phage major capsid protein n=1 Tax=unclassified Oceanobacillus TaxID=2630292 RepID=UPI001BEBF027|nr:MULTISPECIES: phage major capsid protein [unclassified Oceanobacillus]MBT2600950.1 phage major capsid protein [Oceanobacillus sp. ISL-74]MBT2653599.1 phage major capsid protein [Oceanobacillus sp. ISL-73]
MTKHEQDLRQNASDLKDEAKALMDEGKQEEAKGKLKEAKAAKEKLDNFLALKNDFEGISIPEPQAAAGSHIPQPKKEEKPEYKAVFFKAIRGQRLTSEEAETLEEFKAKLSSGTGEDGGYIVPEDITTTINELKQTVDSLEQYVTVESVSTNKGARTLERRADSTPFAPLSEYGTPNAMQEISSPKFDRLGYEIEDYAGFLPVPNHLLDDTDQALEEYLRRWIAKKSRATRNYLILEVLDGFEKVDLVDYKGIKTTLNVDLDPAFAQNAVIFTNQDGFNYLDQLYDGNGRPLLQDDPQDATQKRLFGRLVVVLSNKTIATDSDKAPFIIGDLKEAIVLWDRKQMSLDMTKEGGEAWRSNTTEFRAIEREDVTKWDEEAVVYGQIDITVQPEEGTPEV